MKYFHLIKIFGVYLLWQIGDKRMYIPMNCKSIQFTTKITFDWLQENIMSRLRSTMSKKFYTFVYVRSKVEDVLVVA